MDQDLKKKLAKNWFKILQDILCQNIREIEGNKTGFKNRKWKRSKNKDEVVGEFRI